MKRFPYLALFLTIVFAACSNIPGLSPVATSTSLPTITPPPTNTPTQMPTTTPLPSPTATEQLTPQEQLERDYGHLVPKDEKCVLFPDGTVGYDYTQSNTHYTQLQVRATNPANAMWMKIPLGPPHDQKEREVLVLPVVCRDANGSILKTLLILGGRDFGKDGADLNVYYNHKGGKDFQVVPAQEILEQVQEGDRIEIYVVIKPGDGNFKKLGSNWEGATNDLTKISILMVKDDKQYSDIVNLLAQGGGDIPNDFVIIPDRIDLYSQNN